MLLHKANMVGEHLPQDYRFTLGCLFFELKQADEMIIICQFFSFKMHILETVSFSTSFQLRVDEKGKI